MPLVIEFIPGTRVHGEPEAVPRLPIVQNGPPGTFVIFADGSRVSLPTDQIVSYDTESGSARVTFGGMRSAGLEHGQLVFYRFQDLHPPDQLSPERGTRMTLEPHMVATIHDNGKRVWPPLAS